MFTSCICVHLKSSSVSALICILYVAVNVALDMCGNTLRFLTGSFYAMLFYAEARDCGLIVIPFFVINGMNFEPLWGTLAGLIHFSDNVKKYRHSDQHEVN